MALRKPAHGHPERAKRAEGSRAAAAGRLRLAPRGILLLRRPAPLIASRCLPAPAPRARECNSPLDCCMLRMTTWPGACDPRAGTARAKPTMTENAVECALAEGENGLANSATRRFAERLRAKGADRARRLHTRPRFLSFPVSSDNGRAPVELRGWGFLRGACAGVLPLFACQQGGVASATRFRLDPVRFRKHGRGACSQGFLATRTHTPCFDDLPRSRARSVRRRVSRTARGSRPCGSATCRTGSP